MGHPSLVGHFFQGRSLVRAIVGTARRNENTLLLQSWEQSWAASSDFTHIYAFPHDLICILLLTEELSARIDNVEIDLFYQ